MRILIGVAGFIGSNLASRLVADGHAVTGICLRIPCVHNVGSGVNYSVNDVFRQCGRTSKDF